jgi:hypothetical protein
MREERYIYFISKKPSLYLLCGLLRMIELSTPDNSRGVGENT